MAKTIAICNQKGGVGKTTTAINLSSALSHFGNKVLLVDFDPQGNAGRGLGFDVSTLEKTIFEGLLDNLNWKEIARPTSESNLYILPSNLRLASLDSVMPRISSNRPFYVLQEYLKQAQDSFDYIIIDCPPSLGLLSINALVSSDSVIIPIQCEYFAMEAVAPVLSSISKIQDSYNPKLKIEGFLLTMYDPRTTLGTEVVTTVRGLFKEDTFLTTIPRNISIPEASARGLAVTSFRPSAQGSLAYFALAREVLDHA